MAIFSFSCPIGISSLEACFHTSHVIFSLVYGVEVMIPIKVIVPSTRLALASKHLELVDQVYDVDALK